MGARGSGCEDVCSNAGCIREEPCLEDGRLQSIGNEGDEKT